MSFHIESTMPAAKTADKKACAQTSTKASDGFETLVWSRYLLPRAEELIAAKEQCACTNNKAWHLLL